MRTIGKMRYRRSKEFVCMTVKVREAHVREERSDSLSVESSRLSSPV